MKWNNNFKCDSLSPEGGGPAKFWNATTCIKYISDIAVVVKWIDHCHRSSETRVIESVGIMLLFQKLLALCQICTHVLARL
jgi:hypothetical protein